ncbi:carbohydrate kinase family protein [Flindersiella endophytica]
MARIAVVGHTNLETAVHAEELNASVSDRFAENALSISVSGVGVNVAFALHGLGNDVRFATVVGQDVLGTACREGIVRAGLDASYVVPGLRVTAQSLSRFYSDGSRRNLVDLKDVQGCAYPADLVAPLLDDVELAVICNIGYGRPLLAEAIQRGIPIATDVHAVTGLSDSYNQDWMAAATVLFASHERLDSRPEEFVRQVLARHSPAVVVVGIGAGGSLLGLPGAEPVHVPAARTRPVVNTVGAGDSLFSSFVDGWMRGDSPVEALRRAAVFASWKIGANGGAAGFLDRDAWDTLVP